ncbi:DUF883 family protein [Nitratireductor luteus]|uniref:DUF883 family protein n=1 Tax=Nitratireductor luteus TaxID=2976980 RepID=UPI00224041F7|nr:DUF883 C-terminal domain-containing protein [Nitratireductor luteus]
MATTAEKASNRSTGTRGGTENLESDIQRLRDDIAKLTEDMRKMGNRSLSRARQAATESAEEWQSEITETVREKPFTALAVAAGVGWLLAMMMRR